MCGKSCVDELVKILLCEGGDVKLCARTSKHIFVFAFDPLSLTLSLSHYALHHFAISYLIACIALHISYCYILYLLGLIVCVPNLYLTNKSFT